MMIKKCKKLTCYYIYNKVENDYLCSIVLDGE